MGGGFQISGHAIVIHKLALYISPCSFKVRDKMERHQVFEAVNVDSVLGEEAVDAAIHSVTWAMKNKSNDCLIVGDNELEMRENKKQLVKREENEVMKSESKNKKLMKRSEEHVKRNEEEKNFVKREKEIVTNSMREMYSRNMSWSVMNKRSVWDGYTKNVWDGHKNYLFMTEGWSDSEHTVEGWSDSEYPTFEKHGIKLFGVDEYCNVMDDGNVGDALTKQGRVSDSACSRNGHGTDDGKGNDTYG